MDLEQCTLFNSCKIIALRETWVSGETNKVSLFNNYNLYEKQAIKVKVQGRASGGLIMFIDKKFGVLFLGSYRYIYLVVID